MQRTLLFLLGLLLIAIFAFIGKSNVSQAQTTPADEVAIIQLTTPTNAVGVVIRSVSNDGKRFVFDSINDYDGSNIDSNREIFVYDADLGKVLHLTDTKNVQDPDDATKTTLRVTNNTPIISGDGTKIVFTSNAAFTDAKNDDGNQELYLIDLPRNATKREDARFTRLTDTEKNTASEFVSEIFTNYSPTINDDGSIIAFVSTRRVFKALENGTPAFTVTRESTNTSATPADADYTDNNGELFVYNATTKRYAQVTVSRDRDAIVNFTVHGFNNFPKLSGDGRRLAFLSGFNYPGATANKNSDFNAEIFIYDLSAAANTFLQLTNTTDEANRPTVPLTGGVNLLPAFVRPFNRTGTLFVFESSGDFASKNAEKIREVYLADLSGAMPTFRQITDQTAVDVAKNDLNYNASLNSTGTFVTFASTLNLTPATTSSVTADNADGSREVFRYDIARSAFRQITFTQVSNIVPDQREAQVPSFADTTGNLLTFSAESDLIAANLTLSPEAFRALVFPVTGTNSTAPALTNAASFNNTEVARGSIVAAFGTQLATTTMTAQTVPLPFELAGVRVTVGGFAAQVIFVSPTQINFVAPTPIGAGDKVAFSVNNNGLRASGEVKLVDVSPGVFSLTGDGKGNGAVQCGQFSDDGLAFNLTVPPCSVGNEADSALLVIYGTGWRNGTGLTVKFGDSVLTPTFAGAQPSYPGLDQINVPLIKDLADKTDTDFTVTFGDKTSNTVKTSFSAFIGGFTLAHAASYLGGEGARGSLVLAQGEKLANDTADGAAAGYPTELRGVRVTVAGRPARLSYISPEQVNFIVPDQTAAAEAVAVVINNNGTILRSRLIVREASPGVFTTTGNGDGLALARCVRPNADGSLTLSDPPCAVGTEAAPNRLRVFGSGWRFANAVGILLGDADLIPRYAGPQIGNDGLPALGIDIVEVELPQSLAGKTDVDVIVKTKIRATGEEKQSKVGIKVSFQ